MRESDQMDPSRDKTTLHRLTPGTWRSSNGATSPELSASALEVLQHKSMSMAGRKIEALQTTLDGTAKAVLRSSPQGHSTGTASSGPPVVPQKPHDWPLPESFARSQNGRAIMKIPDTEYLLFGGKTGVGKDPKNEANLHFKKPKEEEYEEEEKIEKEEKGMGEELAHETVKKRRVVKANIGHEKEKRKLFKTEMKARKAEKKKPNKTTVTEKPSFAEITRMGLGGFKRGNNLAAVAPPPGFFKILASASVGITVKSGSKWQLIKTAPNCQASIVRNSESYKLTIKLLEQEILSFPITSDFSYSIVSPSFQFWTHQLMQYGLSFEDQDKASEFSRIIQSVVQILKKKVTCEAKAKWVEGAHRYEGDGRFDFSLELRNRFECLPIEKCLADNTSVFTEDVRKTSPKKIKNETAKKFPKRKRKSLPSQMPIHISTETMKALPKKINSQAKEGVIGDFGFVQKTLVGKSNEKKKEEVKKEETKEAPKMLVRKESRLRNDNGGFKKQKNSKLLEYTIRKLTIDPSSSSANLGSNEETQLMLELDGFAVRRQLKVKARRSNGKDKDRIAILEMRIGNAFHLVSISKSRRTHKQEPSNSSLRKDQPDCATSWSSEFAESAFDNSKKRGFSVSCDDDHTNEKTTFEVSDGKTRTSSKVHDDSNVLDAANEETKFVQWLQSYQDYLPMNDYSHEKSDMDELEMFLKEYCERNWDEVKYRRRKSKKCFSSDDSSIPWWDSQLEDGDDEKSDKDLEDGQVKPYR